MSLACDVEEPLIASMLVMIMRVYQFLGKNARVEYFLLVVVKLLPIEMVLNCLAERSGCRREFSLI